MFPISKDKLSFRKIADYWSREIHPPAGKDELLAHLEKAWWLGEIAGDAGFSRLRLLKHMFEVRGTFQSLVFVTKEDVGPAITVEQPDGTVEVDLRPRIYVPSDTEVWDEVSCAVAFKTLAELPSQEYYPILSPGIDSIEITRDEFVKWLGVNGFDIPTFWGQRVNTKVRLKNASDQSIEKTITDVYDLEHARGVKPPNIRELVKLVQDRLKAKGLEASGRKIQEIGDRPKFRDRRWKVGGTLKSKERKRSS